MPGVDHRGDPPKCAGSHLRRLERSVPWSRPSGFGGALGTISGLLRKSDVAILDNRSHLSLRDGAVLSRCHTEKFEHNDAASLDTALSRQKGRRQLVIIEGIYSMDGDFGNLTELLAVAESHGR